MPTAEALEFGRRLRAARAYGHRDSAREIDQAELGREVGYGRNTIREWESGEVYPKKALRTGIVQVVRDLTGLPREFFEVDFAELRAVMEQHSPLRLDWTPDRIGKALEQFPSDEDEGEEQRRASEG